MLKICYTLPTSAEALRGVGVRIAGADDLAALVKDWKAVHQPSVALSSASSSSSSAASGEAGSSTSGWQTKARRLRLPAGSFTPAGKWPLAVYKGQSKKNPRPRWEESWERFQKSAKEHVSAVSLSSRFLDA